MSRSFWTGVWAFALTMGSLFGVDSLDVTSQPIEVNSWLAAVLLSLIVGLGMYAKAKVEEINGEKR